MIQMNKGHIWLSLFRAESLEDKLYLWGCFLAPVILLVSIYICTKEQSSFGSCIFFDIFHLYCPGCGGTRAIRALCSGRVLVSFWYHPLVPYSAGVYVFFMLSQTWERLKLPGLKGIHYRDAYAYIAIGILAFNFVLKNILVIFFKITM